MIQTYLGTWEKPTKFITESGEQMTIYCYGMTYKQVKDLFPFDCFIQLEGNVVKNYIEM